MSRPKVAIDANQAVSQVAFATNEVIAIYPITPSSTMGEHADAMAAEGKLNIWGVVPTVVELQSEAGAAGAVHGALSAGALSTTFTASQGLLLMIPNMYKIAGELTPTVFHVSARAVATHALSIFGDHSDVMACRQCGWAMLCSASVQEAQDFALIAQAATLEARVPILHFFDGFRTSSEVQKIEQLTHDDFRVMVDESLIRAHRARALSPDHPTIRGTAQNPDVFFQGRETSNPFYAKAPAIIQKAMDKFAQLTGRQYKLFEYVGAADADRVVVVMGSGADICHEVVEHLTAQGEKVGVLKVRLFLPLDGAALLAALPKTVKKLAVLDRTKEPGAIGEPLYQDIHSVLFEAMQEGRLAKDRMPQVVGGRYGLGSKEFSASMAKSVFDNLKLAMPKNHFTVGINEDVTNSSLPWDPAFELEPDTVKRALFFGLGSDGTVGASKNTIKIIGKATENYAQGYSVYDSKKAGALTVSHVRFSPKPIRSSYLIGTADFVGCHSFPMLFQFEMVGKLKKGGVFLLNSPHKPEDVWNHLPQKVQETILAKQARCYVIDAYGIARSIGLGGRINIIMQACFFKLSGVIDQEKALHLIEDAVRDTYGDKGEKVVAKNIQAAHEGLKNLHELQHPSQVTSKLSMASVDTAGAPAFVKEVTAPMILGLGDSLPVSKMPVDGCFPVGTTQYEKRCIALTIPIWHDDRCIQCGLCAFICPHAAIRVKAFPAEAAKVAPAAFKTLEAKGKGLEGLKFRVQVAPEDCTGCGACAYTCPGKAKDDVNKKALMMLPIEEHKAVQRENYAFFLSIPDPKLGLMDAYSIKGSQFLRPLFEYSGACAGCGETAYVKLLTQLFGDRAIIGNATGCSSIYGGNLPTTPYTTRADGRGPTWSNSLFEDAAEFTFGMRLTCDQMFATAMTLLDQVAPADCGELVKAIKAAKPVEHQEIEAQRERVDALKKKLAGSKDAKVLQFLTLADNLVPKAVWAVGGDGWAYDIGYGGLDHVIASGRNVKLMVLDTGVYSNTGGQASKATPRGAIARFAEAGKDVPRKDLGLMAIAYGSVYVAQIALAANPMQTLKAFKEANAYNGPALLIAYSHCIAHGIDMTTGTDTQKEAVKNGFWPLYRYNPTLADAGQNPLQLDSKDPEGDLRDFMMKQNRFNRLFAINKDRGEKLLALAKQDVERRWKLLKTLAG